MCRGDGARDLLFTVSSAAEFVLYPQAHPLSLPRV